MELIALATTMLVLGAMVGAIMTAAGVWATYHAVVRGFNQVIQGLQSVDARLSESSRR